MSAGSVISIQLTAMHDGALPAPTAANALGSIDTTGSAAGRVLRLQTKGSHLSMQRV